jgi:hypothetical protein
MLLAQAAPRKLTGLDATSERFLIIALPVETDNLFVQPHNLDSPPGYQRGGV